MIMFGLVVSLSFAYTSGSMYWLFETPISILSVLFIMILSIASASFLVSSLISSLVFNAVNFGFVCIFILLERFSSSLDLENDKAALGYLSAMGEGVSTEPPIFDLLAWSTSIADMLRSVVIASPAILASNLLLTGGYLPSAFVLRVVSIIDPK